MLETVSLSNYLALSNASAATSFKTSIPRRTIPKLGTNDIVASPYTVNISGSTNAFFSHF